MAADAGVKDAFQIPGFVPEYIRPLFCEGRGPFRWVALSGDPKDLHRTDDLVLELFPENEHLRRWITLARERVAFQGLPARICWLGQGERARFGLALNDLVKKGDLSAPIVIGRDHLDTGSVASPFRETEGMKDGSDAIADWPILNALLNVASGASWVSFHHGGGTGIGTSLHAGQVIVADGTPAAARRLERVLTNDPGIGVARHADAGYPAALDTAQRHGLLVGARQVVTCRGTASARRGPALAQLEVLSGDPAVLLEGDRIAWVGPRKDAPRSAATTVEVRGVLFPGFVDCHTHGIFGAPRLDDHERRALGEDYKTIAAAGGGILQSVRDVRARSEDQLAALARERLTTLLWHGSTTIEVKSGYGLATDAELKQLRAVQRAAREVPATLVPTFLGAHEVPPEYRGRRAEYVRLVCEEMLPAVAREPTSPTRAPFSPRPTGWASTASCTPTSSKAQGEPSWRSSWGRARRITSRPCHQRASRRWRRAKRWRCSCPPR